MKNIDAEPWILDLSDQSQHQLTYTQNRRVDNCIEIHEPLHLMDSGCYRILPQLKQQHNGRIRYYTVQSTIRYQGIMMRRMPGSEQWVKTCRKLRSTLILHHYII